MPTFTSPVSVATFQVYLKDTSTDTTLLAFYQTLINNATEAVYTWLDRDYTASAAKTDIFWGDDTQFHAPRHQAAAFTSWTYTDLSGTTTNPGASDLITRANGFLIQTKTHTFQSQAEHTLTYTQPSTLICPEQVMQVITEIAAIQFEQSNQGAGSLGIGIASSRDGVSTAHERFLDLSQIHKDMLRPYKRYPV
jgi:hypothetical protein